MLVRTALWPYQSQRSRIYTPEPHLQIDKHAEIDVHNNTPVVDAHGAPVPRNGRDVGEILIRGPTVFTGYACMQKFTIEPYEFGLILFVVGGQSHAQNLLTLYKGIGKMKRRMPQVSWMAGSKLGTLHMLTNATI